MTGDNGRERFAYTFGVEEEFFLAHPKSRSLATRVPSSLLRACRRRFGDAVAPELLRSQIELVSPVFASYAEALETMTRLRRGIADIAIGKDLRLFAAGTPPILTSTPAGRWISSNNSGRPASTTL